MASKAQKLRDHKVRMAAASADLPELAPIPRREKNGQLSRRGRARSPDIETLKARCIQMGKEVTPANIRDMRAPWWGCAAGRVIGTEVLDEGTRRDLWSAIVHMRRVATAYDAALGSPRRHAICLRLLSPKGKVEADAETPPADDRDDATKERQATAAHMRLEGWLGYTDKAAAGEAKRVVLDDAICVDRDGLISALRCVSDGIKGKRLRYRGRA
ncbi:hypothetical protein [Paracoccus aminovorans]|uniref:hypothetical protein n=1 Tax=Paracoccus aminovorans TaxID=34004 RepID=UPI0007824529|nr:hypothetical protein [Paracoccus aminovorans]